MHVTAQPFSIMTWDVLLPRIKQDVNCSSCTFWGDVLLPEHTYPTWAAHSFKSMLWLLWPISCLEVVPHHYQMYLSTHQMKFNKYQVLQIYKPSEIINVVPGQKLHSKIQNLIFWIIFWNAQPIITSILPQTFNRHYKKSWKYLIKLNTNPRKLQRHTNIF